MSCNLLNKYCAENEKHNGCVGTQSIVSTECLRLSHYHNVKIMSNNCKSGTISRGMWKGLNEWKYTINL